MFAAALAALLCGASLAAKPTPVPKPKPDPITAPEFVAIDATTGAVLLRRHDREPVPIASLTKVMTALVVIERGDLDRKIQATEAAVDVEDYREGLLPGRWYTRESLLWSALLQSGNDSATALALDAGGGSLETFYGMMNAKARELGMTGTTYASPSGLDDVENLSTAYDQALLARAALRDPTFATMVGTRVHTMPWPWPTVSKELVNHNRKLASDPGTYGVKTGWTTAAQGCLTLAERRGDHAVIAVVLGSAGIWHDIDLLLDKAFAKLDPPAENAALTPPTRG
jgi:D-alanyl-D-alanine carboxypeptidase